MYEKSLLAGWKSDFQRIRKSHKKGRNIKILYFELTGQVSNQQEPTQRA